MGVGDGVEETCDVECQHGNCTVVVPGCFDIMGYSVSGNNSELGAQTTTLPSLSPRE